MDKIRKKNGFTIRLSKLFIIHVLCLLAIHSILFMPINIVLADDTNPNTEIVKKTEWELISEYGKSSILEKKGVRYNKLSSTAKNNNSDKEALFKKEGLKAANDGSATANIKFTDDTSDNESRFGVYVKYLDAKHNIFVGYDRGGWLWSFNNGDEVDYLRTQRNASPVMGEENDLQISLKSDGQLNATNNGISVFNTKNIPTNLIDKLKDTTNIFLKLGTYGKELTTVNIVSDNQDNVPETDTEEDEEIGPDQNDKDCIYDVIKSDNLTASIDQAFPRIKAYTLNGKALPGQVNKLETIRINGKDIKPQVMYQKLDNATAIYNMSGKSPENFIDFNLTLKLQIKGNELHFDVVEINNNNEVIPGKQIDDERKLITSIEFPENYLVAVSSADKNAKFDGSRMSTNTHSNGDLNISVTNPMKKINKQGFMYGFVSNDNLAAGVWSNSQYSYGGGSDDFTRLTIGKQLVGKTNYLGINSSPYIYQRSVNKKVYSEKTFVLPSAKVVISEDQNKDNKVDWQDGAIAYRNIMNSPTGSDSVRDLVAYRVVMNFASQAQNPFVSTLDGIKKVSLNTDGLGQSLLLKGYGSEGHDSGHLNYADIGKRIGGVDDFKKLIASSKNYGAKLGIHVNASETYPESKYFSENILRRDNNNGYSYGWNWLDQAFNINSAYDLGNGRRERFEDLKNTLGDGLDFVYVDVWGNGQAGEDTAWATHQLAKEINDLNWRVAFEWGYAGEYDSTFQHWAADLTYGGYALKGINSNIVRFIRNHQKDSWIGNYPSYGGAAKNPLLGGYNMKDFEGWQERSDYNNYIKNIFENNLTTKYIQHFEVTNWENGTPVKMSDNGQSYNWTPEMQVKLSDDENRELVINRKSNVVTEKAYEQRHMTLDGRTVYDESAYLLPWEWDSNGKKLDEEHKKFYYFNKNDAKTTWDLPKAYGGKKLYIYELSDLGKVNQTETVVKDNKISLSLKANTPYVIYSKAQQSDVDDMAYGEGAHIKDPGFNSGKLKDWSIVGNKKSVSIVYSQGGANPMLTVSDNKEKISMTQKLTDLKPNTSYAVYLGVDNRSTSSANLKVSVDKLEFLNSTGKSNQLNQVNSYSHANHPESYTIGNSSYFQNMYTFFSTKDKVDDVYLTLERNSGAGSTYFDDIRVVENNATMYDGQHDSHSFSTFSQDFENVAQGIFPFVVNTSFSDSRVHLSELHEPYTQRGFNGKVISDVISGSWSLKTNGLTQRNSMLYRTIPQNFLFKPNTKYKISFKYESGSSNTYAFAVGNGKNQDKEKLSIHKLKASSTDANGAVNATYEVEGDANGETYIGIFSTSEAAQTEGSSGSEANFRSYNDFILDDLLIEEVSNDKLKTEKENAKKKIDAMEKISSAQKESSKKLIDAAESKEVIEKILKELEDVKVIPIKEIALNVTGIKSLKKKNSLQLELKFTPENATNQDINWIIDKPDVIKISSDNVLTGLALGVSKVTAKTANGKTATFTIRVTK